MQFYLFKAILFVFNRVRRYVVVNPGPHWRAASRFRGVKVHILCWAEVDTVLADTYANHVIVPMDLI